MKRDMLPGVLVFAYAYYSNSWFVQGQEVMAKSRMRIVAPSTEKRTVTPKRRPNADSPHSEVALRVYLGARRTVQHGRLCAHGRAGWRGR